MRSFAVPCVRSEQISFGQFCWCWEFRLLSQGQCFLFDYQFKAVHRFMLFLLGMRCRFLGGYYVLKPGRANRLTPIVLAEFVFLMLSLRRLVVYGRNHPCGDKYGDELDVPCHLQVFGLEVGCDTSDLSIYNSCV